MNLLVNIFEEYKFLEKQLNNLTKSVQLTYFLQEFKKAYAIFSNKVELVTDTTSSTSKTINLVQTKKSQESLIRRF